MGNACLSYWTSLCFFLEIFYEIHYEELLFFLIYSFIILVLIFFTSKHNVAEYENKYGFWVFFAFVTNFTLVTATCFLLTFSDYSDYEDSSVEFLDRCSSPLTRSSGSSLTLRSMFSEKNTSYQYPRAILSVDLSGESRLAEQQLSVCRFKSLSERILKEITWFVFGIVAINLATDFYFICWNQNAYAAQAVLHFTYFS